MNTYQNKFSVGLDLTRELKPIHTREKALAGWKRKGFLFGVILTSSCLPLVAQTEMTTTTTTASTPVVAPVVVQPAATTVSTTKVTTQMRTLFLRDIYQGSVKNGSQVFVRPNGKIYDQDGDYVGHLTDLNGDDIRSIPLDHRYKIRNAKGTIIASTKLTPAYDSGRTITLARQDSNGQLIAEAVETTRVTTTPAPVVVPTPVQSSTTTTTTTTAP